MKRQMFGTLARLMCVAFLGAMPKMGFAEEGKWTKKADMPTPRDSLSTSVVNGKIYAIGGWSKGGPLSTGEEYDPATNQWIKKTDMPTARGGLSTSVVNGKIYAIGGFVSFVDPPLSTVEEYDTGLAGEGIEAKGKLVTVWGTIKSTY
ncbi:hypothetical protein HYR99_36830 [Candidatus Poribacteria bacterium]|nr:hypothetical protein [Candidatus Poribacteria bacterium]